MGYNMIMKIFQRSKPIRLYYDELCIERGDKNYVTECIVYHVSIFNIKSLTVKNILNIQRNLNKSFSYGTTKTLVDPMR